MVIWDATTYYDKLHFEWCNSLETTTHYELCPCINEDKVWRELKIKGKLYTLFNPIKTKKKIFRESIFKNKPKLQRKIIK